MAYSKTDIIQWKSFLDELDQWRSDKKAFDKELSDFRNKPLEGLLAGKYDDDSDYWVRRIMEHFGGGPLGTKYDRDNPTIIGTLRRVAEDTGYSIEYLWNAVMGEPDEEGNIPPIVRDPKQVLERKAEINRYLWGRVEDKYQEAKRIFERIKEDYPNLLYLNKHHLDLTQDDIEMATRDIMSELIKDDPAFLSAIGGLMPWVDVLDPTALAALEREDALRYPEEADVDEDADEVEGGLTDLLTPKGDAGVDLIKPSDIDRPDFPVIDHNPAHTARVNRERLNLAATPVAEHPSTPLQTNIPIDTVSDNLVEPARTREYSPSGLTQLAGAYNPSVVGTSHPWASPMQTVTEGLSPEDKVILSNWIESPETKARDAEREELHALLAYQAALNPPSRIPFGMQGGGSVANPMSFLKALVDAGILGKKKNKTASQMLSMASPTSKRRRLTKYSSPQAAAIKALYENAHPDLNAFVSEGGLENLPNVRRKDSMIQRIKQKLAAAKRYEAAKGGMVPQTSFANGGLVELYKNGGYATNEDEITALTQQIKALQKELVTGEAARLKEQAARQYERWKEPNSLAYKQFVSRYTPPEESFEEITRKQKEDIINSGEGVSGLVQLLLNKWRTDEWDADIGRGIFDTETREWFEDNWDREEPLKSMIHIVEDWLQSDKGEQLDEVDKKIASNAAMGLAFYEEINNAMKEINSGIDNREALGLSQIELAGMEERLAELKALRNKTTDASDKNLPINWKLIAAGLAATTGGGGETFGETGTRMMQAYHGEEAAQAGARQAEADVIAKLAQARGFDAASMSPLFTLIADIEKSKSAAQEKILDRRLKTNLGVLDFYSSEVSPFTSPEIGAANVQKGATLADLLLNQSDLGSRLTGIRDYTATRKQ
tara:strand:+ start:78 stop:2750 length:2673 start_codon:yes stop_codon:yes gene_type:complete